LSSAAKQTLLRFRPRRRRTTRQQADFAEAELQLLTVVSPFDARVLEVNVRAGEFASAGAEGIAAIVLGRAGKLQVRAQIEEADLARFENGEPARALQRGGDGTAISLSFVRREPLLRPKTTLSGGATERIDTRVLEVLYETDDLSLMPGQLVDVLIGTDQQPPAPPG
jgi:HlyD family secretion protein